MGVGRGLRIPDPHEHDVPVIATTVMDRIVKAGHWLSRCSGTQDWVKRDWGQLREHAAKTRPRPRGAHLRALQLHPPGRDDRARPGRSRSRGSPSCAPWARHRSWEHLQECYMVGSIDRINARIADLVGAGLQYLVLGPVTDDPRQIDLIATRIVPNF